MTPKLENKFEDIFLLENKEGYQNNNVFIQQDLGEIDELSFQENFGNIRNRMFRFQIDISDSDSETSDISIETTHDKLYSQHLYLLSITPFIYMYFITIIYMFLYFNIRIYIF